MMLYEIHVTVDCKDIRQFKNDCHQIGIKPIVIETIKGPQQVMTSSSYKDENYLITLQSITNDLSLKGYNVVRQKVEIKPKSVKHSDFKYYESHLRLKLDKNFDKTELIAACKRFNFHLSKNLFKTSENFDYQMITYRDYDSDLNAFHFNVSKMKAFINAHISDTCCDKIEIEECILDSNLTIDKEWLTN